MSFGLWAQLGRNNHVLDGGPEVLRDVAMAITGFVGYNFGCCTERFSAVDTVP